MGSEAETPRGPEVTPPSEREAPAGGPDRAAGQGEAFADERERRLDERERWLDERARAIKDFLERLEAGSRELVESSRGLLAASRESLGPQVGAVEGPGGGGRPQQAATGTAAGGKPDPVPAPAGLTALIDRAGGLRQRLKATLADLAATEEEVARVHDEIAARRPGNTDRYWLAASQARARARQLRDIEGHFHD